MFRKIIAENFALNISDRLNNQQVKYFFNFFLKTINWSKDEIISFQVDKIKELLKYSYKHSKFYHKRFDDAGFRYDNFKYPDELNKIPPLTRKDLQDNLNEIISSEIDLSNCTKGSSSGSTGNPVKYYHDRIGLSANKASVLFAKHLGGYKLGDPWVNIWGHSATVNIEWKKLSSRSKSYLLNEKRFVAYNLNDAKAFEVLFKLVMKKKPKSIYGYTNALYLFAKYLEERNVKLDFIDSVFTTAENLQEYQKNKLEERIGKVFDHYGCSEINGIAVQTKFDKYYSIIEPKVFVELMPIENSTQVSKKIVVTDLYNKVLPFIRYENGDLASEAINDNNENYSLNFSKLKSIDGRMSDIIKLPSGGSLVVPSFLGSGLLKQVNGIKQYQVIKNESKITVNLIVENIIEPDIKQKILNTLNQYLHNEFKVELVFNQEIINSTNGKFKLFIDISNRSSSKTPNGIIEKEKIK